MTKCWISCCCCLFAVHQGNCVHILKAVSFIFCYELHKKNVFFGKIHSKTLGAVRVYLLPVLLLALKEEQNVIACLFRGAVPSRESGAS